MKSLYLALYTFVGVSLSSCSSFLDTEPYDQLSPGTFWKTEADVHSAVTACYNNWTTPTGGTALFFDDCLSDIGFNFSNSASYRSTGNGSMSQSATVSYYDYTTIRRCNTFLVHSQKVDFVNSKEKEDLLAQVRTIRAWRYFHMNIWYGGVPLITGLPETAEEAKQPRASVDEIKKFVYDELDAAIAALSPVPAQRGRIAKGTALAIKMRAALYWGDLDLAMTAARSIQDLNIYSIDPDFLHMFTINGQGSPEIIYALQHVKNTYPFGTMIRLYNNQDGGWASMVPTQDFVDMFEMKTGSMPLEVGSGYDAVHPFANRDPRLALTVLYPGMDWIGMNGKPRIINTLDKTINGTSNADYMDAADNSSHTGLLWAKYIVPTNQYSPSLNNESTSPILFRYAEVLLTIAEINIEKNEKISEALDIIDQLRIRGGHIAVNRSQYTSQNELRTLLRRERAIELAGEGLRRQDIIRWKDAGGKMLAESLMNRTVYRMLGTVDMKENDRDLRTIITIPTTENASLRKLEDRVFKPYHKYLPFPQSELDKNKNLEQNEGYVN
ncbi:RagB/SusD family nutrient uptake outer membrane protein [Sphingobacterium sp. SG20118]|uniref:RagB/SusD family nutrient uptake outer membrane protein n=1 Tax=Sphingobacterium sp. SG20118 TaxID=3367156 RepID=UPI0037DFC480